jgi:hypothetical protein
VPNRRHAAEVGEWILAATGIDSLVCHNRILSRLQNRRINIGTLGSLPCRMVAGRCRRDKIRQDLVPDNSTLLFKHEIGNMLRSGREGS